MTKYTHLVLVTHSTGTILKVKDSDTAEAIFDGLQELCLPLNMCLCESAKEANDYLRKQF